MERPIIQYSFVLSLRIHPVDEFGLRREERDSARECQTYGCNQDCRFD
ncbi:MAG: hypothetical protein Q4C95_05175 [Planctomycetia bacterium]|nr:hypothetical protein [Planctomycetia bacterium]